MKNLALVITVALAMSCAPKESSEWQVSNGELIQEHLDEFIEQANMRGVKIRWRRVEFVYSTEILNRNIAYADRKNHQIVFDTAKWETLLPKIVYHELGHYLLERDHVTYESIMKIGIVDIDSDPEYYWDELFNN